MLEIIEIEPGSKKVKNYRGRILYAKLVDDKGELVISADLGFILMRSFKNMDRVSNYEEALKKYIDFNDHVMKELD